MLLRRLGYRATSVDVDQDPELQARFGDEVPVLVVDGRVVLAGILREREARRVLAAALRSA